MKIIAKPAEVAELSKELSNLVQKGIAEHMPRTRKSGYDLYLLGHSVSLDANYDWVLNDKFGRLVSRVTEENLVAALQSANIHYDVKDKHFTMHVYEWFAGNLK